MRIIFIVLCVSFLAACNSGLPGSVMGPEPRASGAAKHWRPITNTTWQWQLTGVVNTVYSVDVYDVDLFDTAEATISLIKSRGGRVVCYFSAGSAEDWRPDFSRFAGLDKGRALDGWSGEHWVDTRSESVRQVMVGRLDLAKAKGCDAVEPDNVDGYENVSGFNLSAGTQLNFNLFLASSAHARGLAIGLKNDIRHVGILAPIFDFAINEQCFEYKECEAYTAFTDLNKPVFNAEYAERFRLNTGGARDVLCRAAKGANIRTLVLPLQLDDSMRSSCD